VNDGIYYPNYSQIDANIQGIVYKLPAHWVFYDGDLDKVRAEIAKNVILAKNMPFK